MTKKILVVDFGLEYGSAVEGLGDLSLSLTDFENKPEEFCLVMFTGGEDVDPSFYGETSPKNMCGSNSKRDEREAILFSHAVEHKIPMVGICRGLQFLNVMNGGRMIHHLDKHTGGRLHEFECNKDNFIIEVNSLHHQMIIPGRSTYVIGWCPTKESSIYFGDEDKPVDWPGPEIEAAYFPKTRCAGVQYHPEMMSRLAEGYKWFYEMAEDLMELTEAEFTAKYVRGTQNAWTA